MGVGMEGRDSRDLSLRPAVVWVGHGAGSREGRVRLRNLGGIEGSYLEKGFDVCCCMYSATTMARLSSEAV